MTEHTPTPWIADPDDREGMKWNVHIVEAARPHMRVCFMTSGPEAEGNAAFIVKAVNNHQPMVDAICGYLETFDRCGGSESVSAEEFAECRQRLRDAVGGVR